MNPTDKNNKNYKLYEYTIEPENVLRDMGLKFDKTTGRIYGWLVSDPTRYGQGAA